MPDLLPNGRIAYADYFEPIVTSPMDGTERRVVISSDSPCRATSTCQQGEWIAFNTGPAFASVDIWKIRTDGTDLTNLAADSEANDVFPAWSADCQQIVFRSSRDGNKEIYLMDADASDLRHLTHHPATDTAPALPPDGTRVVYATTPGGPSYQLRI